MTDLSESFYSRHAGRYADVAAEFLQSRYIASSHPKLWSDWDLLERLKELAPGTRGLDAGCGAGARDVYALWGEGFDIYGIDSVADNIRVAEERHPQIADRLSVGDLRKPLPFADGWFDFVLCNAVIQHIEPDIVKEVTLPELVRVLRREGILQLMFKNGHGMLQIFDKDYGETRTFRLYDPDAIMEALQESGCELVGASEPEGLGGVMYFTDPKPVSHAAFYARKLHSSST